MRAPTSRREALLVKGAAGREVRRPAVTSKRSPTCFRQIAVYSSVVKSRRLGSITASAPIGDPCRVPLARVAHRAPPAAVDTHARSELRRTHPPTRPCACTRRRVSCRLLAAGFNPRRRSRARRADDPALYHKDVPIEATDVCPLCSEPALVCQSHVIPKFVFDWLKTRGRSIRSFGQPNIPLQDGPKRRMLCQGCETRLSTWERPVASQIFYPLHRGSASSFQYGQWFLKFAVSLSFRVLEYFQGWVRAPESEATRIASCVRDAQASWAAFLTRDGTLLGPYEHHCVVLPSQFPDSPEGRMLRHFFVGTVDFQPATATPDSSIVVVTKMGRLCIIGTIVRPRKQLWENTRIAANGGTIAPPFQTPTWFLDYLRDRFNAVRSGTQHLSARQRALLWEKAHREGWIMSPTP